MVPFTSGQWEKLARLPGVAGAARAAGGPELPGVASPSVNVDRCEEHINRKHETDKQGKHVGSKAVFLPQFRLVLPSQGTPPLYKIGTR
jgi:hypothetical protein